MRASDYSTVLHQRIEAGDTFSELFQRLDAILVRRGHEKLKRAILVDLMRQIDHTEDHAAPRLILAREEDRAKHERAIEADLKALKTTENPGTRIDNTLTGGYIVEHRFRRIDRSYKRMLRELYERTTKTATTT